jgi:hypothetical protein
MSTHADHTFQEKQEGLKSQTTRDKGRSRHVAASQRTVRRVHRAKGARNYDADPLCSTIYLRITLIVNLFIRASVFLKPQISGVVVCGAAGTVGKTVDIFPLFYSTLSCPSWTFSPLLPAGLDSSHRSLKQVYVT